MSEKRFIFATNEKWFLFDNEDEEYMDMEDCKDKLNEQQATIDKLRVDIRATRTTIRKLQDLCGESDGENAKLRIENKRLQEENEQLKSERRNDAKEFSALFKQNFGLKRENEQLREINKELGDDLYNCRINKNIISEKLKLWQDAHKKYDIYSIKDFEELMKTVREVDKVIDV